MNTPHLARISYSSELRTQPSRAELDALLSSWRRDNAEHGVTGLLLHHAGSVFQVIEGFPEVVIHLFDAIQRDPRHGRLTRLTEEPLCGRGFGDWSMGHGRITPADLGSLPSLQRCLDPAFRYSLCDPLTAEALISAFTTGPWRRSIV